MISIFFYLIVYLNMIFYFTTWVWILTDDISNRRFMDYYKKLEESPLVI